MNCWLYVFKHAIVALALVSGIGATQAQSNNFLNGIYSQKGLQGLMDGVQKLGDRIQHPVEKQTNEKPVGADASAIGNAPSQKFVAAANADEFCSALKTNPLVIDYVKALSKAVKTGTTADDAVFTATVRQFDNEEGQLRNWVSQPPEGIQEKQYVYIGKLVRKVSAWASLCAAKNNDNDLFLIFVSDLREPERITALRAKAKAALNAYEKTTDEITSSKLDVNGLPVVVDKKVEKELNFYVLERGSSTVTPQVAMWAAFAIPNGLNALNSTGKGKAQALSQIVDQTAERSKIEATAALMEEQKMTASPNSLLQQAYQAMQLVQLCSDVRKGYAAIYVSDADLADAKDKMRKIEVALNPKLTGETSDQIWNKASYMNQDYSRGVKTATYANGRSYCELFKRDMGDVAGKVLGKSQPLKTF